MSICVCVFLLHCDGDKIIEMDKATNLSLERQAPSVGIKDASPHSPENEL